MFFIATRTPVPDISQWHPFGLRRGISHLQERTICIVMSLFV